MKYLLDTNVWIRVLKGRDIILLDKFTRIKPETLVVCAPVRAELMYGAQKYSDVAKRESEVISLIDKSIPLPFDDTCADVYALIRHRLEMRRCVIGPYDLQIAAIALVHDLTVVTGNVGEFSRIPGLRVEDWSVG